MSIREICTTDTLDLDKVIAALSVRALDVRRHVIGPGQRQEFACARSPSIYFLCDGQLIFTSKNNQAVTLEANSLIVIPTGHSCKFERPDCSPSAPWPAEAFSLTQSAILIGGSFCTSYGASTDLFDTLPLPVVETFEPNHGLAGAMKKVVRELTNSAVGSQAMVAALMKQVLVCFIRMSLTSNNLWLQNFAVLSDPQVARAFSAMIANPGKPHTVISLAEVSCLSRSAFMSRFTHVIGRSPMVVLREIRMNSAASQLLAGHYSLDQIMYNVGYTGRGSFVRAFRKIYGVNPADYRESIRCAPLYTPVTDRKSDSLPVLVNTLCHSIA